jgi:signal transduction histidine kinase/ligand-binding sensor domain-containing protein
MGNESAIIAAAASMLRSVLTCIGVVVAACQLKGATSVYDFAPTQFALTSWTEGDGLPANAIRALAQDSEGYLWLGTRAGLVRFDGVRFVVWDHDSDATQTENDITAVYAARDGSLWIGYGGAGGMSHLKNGRVAVYRPSDGVRQGYVQAIFEDRDGVIWAGGPGGLSRFRENHWEPVGAEDGLANESILSLYQDRHDTLWVGSAAGAFLRKPGTRPFSRLVRTHVEEVQGFSEDASGALWVSDRRGPLEMLSAGEAGATRPPSVHRVSSRVIHDAHGNLWIAHRRNGLLYIPRGSAATDSNVRRFTVEHGLAGNDVSALLEDREGNIWVATDGGLNRFSPSLVSLLSDVNAENGGIAVTPDGSVWIANEDRIVRSSNGHRTWFTERDGLPGTRITALHADRRGTLWAATNGGVARYSGSRFAWTRFKTPGAPKAIQVMADHPRGGLWLSATNGQRFRWHEGRIEAGPDPPELKDKLTWALYTGRDGTVWEGFADGTLAMHRDDVVQVYSAGDGLAPGSVNAITEDETGTIWVGTSTGLSRLKDGRFSSLPLRKILPGNMVVAIVEDSTGYLWLGMSSGILRLHPAEFDKALNPAHEIQYTFYGSSEGLRGFPYRRVFSTGVRGGDAILRFVTSSGIAVLDPRRATGPRPIGVRIEGISVDGHASSLVARMPARTARVDIAYRALSLTDAEKIQYRHMLEGFDAGWVNTGSFREASYSNLRPGHYRFRVAARNAGGVWSEPPAVWDFSLQPAFYQTSWFYAASALAGILVLFGAWQLRQRQIERQFAVVIEERARMAREIHDTLLQSLVGLTLQLDAVSSQWDSAPTLVKQQLTRMRRQVSRYIRETRQSIWHLRSTMLDTHDLSTALLDVGQNLTAGSDVRFEHVVTGEPAHLMPRVDEQLLRIGQEAISNAVRHAQATIVRLELEFDRAAVHLRVVDDGRGFDRTSAEREPELHLGLKSMEERAFRIGARFRIASRLGAGTTVEATVPLSPRQGAGW